MIYLRKILKVFTIALVVCVLLFSVISASAAYDPPIYTFLPIQTIVPTLPPQFTFFTFIPFITPAPSDSSSLVYFEDAHLQNAIAVELGVSTSDLTKNYLNSVTGTLDLSKYDISKLTGIESLTSLDNLILRNNPITSYRELRQLQYLTNLEYLDISALSVTQIPSEIKKMTGLKYLDISANRLDTLPSALEDLNLDYLVCNYCFFDITDPDFISTLMAATSAADYQYQLQKVDFYAICQTAGIVTLKWDEMPDIYFPNGAVAQIERFSICEPDPSGSQGDWIDSVSRNTTSYTFEGLNSSQTYSFDISVDYYIKNTQYDGKLVKFYEKELFQPIPQDTPTPKPTDTPVPTDTPMPTDTPTPELTAEPTSAAAEIITINPGENNNNGNSSNSSFLSTLVVLLIVLIVAIFGLVIVLFLRTTKPPVRPDSQDPPK